MTRKKKTLTQAALAQFTATEACYPHHLVPGVRYTEGVRRMAEAADAYWLIDLIASFQGDERFIGEDFQVWTLKVHLHNGGAYVTCEDGQGRQIDGELSGFTDFPLREITLYFTSGVLTLTSEY